MTKKLLLVDLHHLGDAVLSLPFIAAAQKACEVWVCCRPQCHEIFNWLLPTSQCLPWDPPWHEESPANNPLAALGSMRNFARTTLATKHFSSALCVWDDPRVHWLMRMAEIPERIGFPASPANHYAADFPPRRRSLWLGMVSQYILNSLPGRPLLTKVVNKNSQHQHHHDSWQQLANLALDCRLELSLVNQLLPLQGAEQSPHAIAIAPFARLPSKTWPIDSFRGLANRIQQDFPHVDIRWLIPPDQQLEEVGGKVVTTGTITELLQNIAGAQLLVTNDSLPSHLAGICNTPAVSIFRTGNPEWFKPLAANSVAAYVPLSGSRPIADADNTPSYVALSGPTIDEVASHVSKILQIVSNSA